MFISLRIYLMHSTLYAGICFNDFCLLRYIHVSYSIHSYVNPYSDPFEGYQFSFITEPFMSDCYIIFLSSKQTYPLLVIFCID